MGRKRIHPESIEKINSVSMGTFNVPASSLKIGSWTKIARHDGEIVVKYFFKKRVMVWEVLEDTLKSKFEIKLEDIAALSADSQEEILEILLNAKPTFYKEIDLQPRKYSKWEPCIDSKEFTLAQQQASLYRKHILRFYPGGLEKFYNKTIELDTDMRSLINIPFPAEDDLTFEHNSHNDHYQVRCQSFAPLSQDNHQHQPLPSQFQNGQPYNLVDNFVSPSDLSHNLELQALLLQDYLTQMRKDEYPSDNLAHQAKRAAIYDHFPSSSYNQPQDHHFSSSEFFSLQQIQSGHEFPFCEDSSTFPTQNGCIADNFVYPDNSQSFEAQQFGLSHNNFLHTASDIHFSSQEFSGYEIPSYQPSQMQEETINYVGSTSFPSVGFSEVQLPNIQSDQPRQNGSVEPLNDHTWSTRSNSDFALTHQDDDWLRCQEEFNIQPGLSSFLTPPIEQQQTLDPSNASGEHNVHFSKGGQSSTNP